MNDKGKVVVLAFSSAIGWRIPKSLSGEKKRSFVDFLYSRRIKQLGRPHTNCVKTSIKT
jgi:hypothetical protein